MKLNGNSCASVTKKNLGANIYRVGYIYVAVAMGCPTTQDYSTKQNAAHTYPRMVWARKNRSAWESTHLTKTSYGDGFR